MMRSTQYVSLELLILLVACPIVMALPVVAFFKIFIGVLGFVYSVWLLLRVEKIMWEVAPKLNWKLFWK